MLNIREDLKKLLIEASETPKANIESPNYITPDPDTTKTLTLEDEELEEIAEADEDTPNEASSGEAGFWTRYSFRELCYAGLDNKNCLGLVSTCLSRDFNPSPTVNPAFTLGLNQVISFYVDILESYKAGELVGKVKTAVDTLIETNRISAKGVAGIKGFFTNKNKKLSLTEKPYEEMIKDLTNLCIAADIINWERIMTYQNSQKYGFDLLILNDIFKPKNEQSPAVNQEFISNVSEPALDEFYKSNNKFAKYLSTFAWGRRGHLIENRLIEAVGVEGDLGSLSGDNDRFVLNMLISYIINILKNNNNVNAGSIIKLANLLSIKNAKTGVTMGNISSYSAEVNTNPNAATPEMDIEDLDNPDYASALASAEWGGKGHGFEFTGGELERPEDELADVGVSEDLHAAEDFRRYVEKVRTENNWTTENNLVFLSHALKTSEGADGLSVILSKLFQALPATTLGVSYNSPVVINNKIQEISILDKFKDMALTSNFIKFLSDLAFLIAKSDKTRLRQENKLYIKKLLSEDISSLDTEITPIEVEELIAALPKTLPEAKTSISVGSSRSDVGFKTNATNKEVEKINNIYDKLASKISLFHMLSPSKFDVIPPEGLLADSYLQKTLGINIEPSTTPGIVGIATQQKWRGQTRARTENLNLLWDVYFNSIKEILDPGGNIASWGLLTPTLLSDRPGDTEAAYGILYPTVVDNKIKTSSGKEKTVKPLFLNSAAFTPFRESVLSTIASKKERFLTATNLEEIKQILTEILAAFGDKKQLRFFSSPLTQSIDNRKKCPLYKLIDPSRAIGSSLANVNRTHAFPPAGGTTTNPFEDLVTNVLVMNNKTTNDSIIYNSALSLFEAEENTTDTAYELSICYVIINTHIRARLLLSLARIIELLQDVLVLLREVVLSLETVLTEKLSEDNIGATEKFFADLAEIIVSVISEREDTSLAGIKTKIAEKVAPINNQFKQAELARRKTSALKDLRSPEISFGES